MVLRGFLFVLFLFTPVPRCFVVLTLLPFILFFLGSPPLSATGSPVQIPLTPDLFFVSIVTFKPRARPALLPS